MPEMARKLVENEFWTFYPPHPQLFLGGVQKNVVENEKIKVVQNCLKWRENWSKTSVGLFNPLPPQKIKIKLGVYKKICRK